METSPGTAEHGHCLAFKTAAESSSLACKGWQVQRHPALRVVHASDG
jgi:hypothetical protein